MDLAQFESVVAAVVVVVAKEQVAARDAVNFAYLCPTFPTPVW